MIKQFINRIISDYFLSNRISKYEDLIVFAKDNGYQFIAHSEFYKLTNQGKIGDKKYFLIRHDIDSDPKYCDYWLAVEKKYNIKSAYYFRLCTLDYRRMFQIHHYGSDCGYHYEEIADYIKENKILIKDEAINSFSLIRQKFIKNFHHIQNNCGFKLTSIASHGDFANTKIGINNHALITKDLKLELGIEFECYEPQFVQNYSINISDCTYPRFFKDDPFEAIRREEKVIHLHFVA